MPSVKCQVFTIHKVYNAKWSQSSDKWSQLTLQSSHCLGDVDTDPSNTDFLILWLLNVLSDVIIDVNTDGVTD